MDGFRKGILLAGGNGSRLAPLTNGISKQLMPIYDKPMIYYPLSTLMLSGIREFLIICKKEDLDNFERLLGNGNEWGISIQYKIQKKPNGIAQALLIAEEFLNGSSSALILGDNLFYGQNLIKVLKKANRQKSGATIFAYNVRDPERFGIVNFDKEFSAIEIEEKPKKPKSNFAITGLYFYDSKAVEIAKKLRPSDRGELEISDLNKHYLRDKELKVEIFSRGVAWLDAGTFDSLIDAGSFIKTIEYRQGLKVSCPEEIAWRSGWISKEILIKNAEKFKNSSYGEYLLNLCSEELNQLI
tara:strand:- start:329 stop:1225 length:897 start_codon:yes stop_codon:yes gene_type:complete